ncbi:MAG: GNAT family N-acetyltransferase, partial [Methyloligellaceae bacterium]
MPVLDLPLPFIPDGSARPGPARNADDTTLDGLFVATASRPEDVASEWGQLEKFGSVPFSNSAWVNAWYEAHRDDPNVSPLIVVGKAASGEPHFLLPLVRERRGPFTVIVWPGGTHSAYHCGLFSPECRALVTPDNAKIFWARVFGALPRADALALYGLPSFEIERRNPLSYLPLLECGCASYRLALSQDWDALYTSKTSAKMRSNDRRSERRLAQHGALRFRVAQTREER